MFLQRSSVNKKFICRICGNNEYKYNIGNNLYYCPNCTTVFMDYTKFSNNEELVNNSENLDQMYSQEENTN